MNDSDKIFKAFSNLTATKGTYHNKWICDESLVRILHMHYTNLKDIDNIRSKLVRRLNSQSGAFDYHEDKKYNRKCLLLQKRAATGCNDGQ